MNTPTNATNVADLHLSEIDLIEKAALRVGMKSLMNYGAGSLVYSEGVNGVTQEHIIAFAREIALHCAVALSASPGAVAAEPTGWQPISTAPKNSTARLVWCPGRKNIYAATWFEKLGWCVFGGKLLSEEEAPTHWMPLPPAPKE